MNWENIPGWQAQARDIDASFERCQQELCRLRTEAAELKKATADFCAKYIQTHRIELCPKYCEKCARERIHFVDRCEGCHPDDWHIGHVLDGANVAIYGSREDCLVCQLRTRI